MPGNVVLFIDENKTQSQKAPEGASRCRVWTSGIVLYLIGSRSAARVLKLVTE
ncbi:hypothetical protein EV128_13327 [Rhizobium azibense]|nr:hypothetical protein EV128_13327 [Rhizobium azibense]